MTPLDPETVASYARMDSMIATAAELGVSRGPSAAASPRLAWPHTSVG